MGCVSQYSYLRKSIPHEPGMLGSKHAVKFSKGTWHQIKIRERKGPSRGIVQKCAQVLARRNSRTDHMRKPCTKKDAHAKQWDLAKNIDKLMNSDKATLYIPGEAKVMSTFVDLKRPEEREFVVGSGASMHVMSKKELSSEEMGTVKRSRTPTVVLTANGEVHTHEEAQVFVHDLNQFVTVQLLEETPAVPSLGKLCKDHGYSFGWVSGQEPGFTQHGKSITCKRDNFVPPVVPGESVNSESSLSSTTSSQDSLGREAEIASRNLVRPASSLSSSSVLERSDELATRRLGQGSLRSDKNDENDPLADLPFWLEDFTDMFEPTEVRAPAHISQNSDSEHTIKKATKSRKHSIFTHFPKDRDCHVCLITKTTRASCRRCAGTVMPRAENFGDLMTADHKVLSEGCESRKNHRYAVVLQDLATQWIQCYPCKTKTSQETEKRLRKFREPSHKPKVI